MPELATFGQELYYEESVRAIEQFSDEAEARHVTAKIAELLPHPSRATRLRVASKIHQRFFKPPSTAFLKLVRNTKDETARHDLLYWRAARTDAAIAALAVEVFYPYFVLGEFPRGYDEDTFPIANTATLFAMDRVISRDFAVRFARDMWGFDSARTITLALRIMKQAGVLDSVSVKLGRRHVLGYYPQPHTLAVNVFAYCLYEEFLDSTPTASLDRIHNGDCVKLFFINRLQADSLLGKMEKQKLIELATLPSGKHVRFAFRDLSALVERLINL